MINKIGKLTYNEIYKQIKKKSIVIILIFSMILSLALPFAIKAIKPDATDEVSRERNEMWLQDSQNELEQIKNDDKEKEIIRRIKVAIKKAEVEGRKVELDYNYVYDDWRTQEFERVKNKFYPLEIYKLVLEGINSDELIRNVTNINVEDLKEFLKLSKIEQEKTVRGLEEDINLRKNIIGTNDYLGFLKNEIKSYDELINIFEERLKESKKELEKDKKNQDLINTIEDCEKNIAYTKKAKAITQYRIDNKIDFSNENWKNNTLKEIELIEDEFRYGMNSEYIFQKNQAVSEREMTYEEYKKDYEVRKNLADEKIAKNWYSLENDIPQLQFTKDARSIISGYYDVFVVIAVILVLIIGGGIVATEFSTGTVRLLVIRPVKRWKILLSKLLALFTIGLSVVIICTLLLSLSSGISYGFESVNLPILKYVDGNVVEGSFIAYLLGSLKTSLCSLIFMIGVVFAVTTLAKNTALAVAISMILYIGALPITMILGMLKMSFIGGTFIPFMNVSLLNLAPSFKTTLFESYGIILKQGSGEIQLIAIAIVLIIISFVTFSKKDIRN